MTLLPTQVPPVKPLLGQVAKLLREGVEGWVWPEPFVEPYWADWDHATARTGAPEGHFLLPEGTRLYLDEHRVEVRAPYCIVALGGDPEALDQRVPSIFWRVPVVVELGWTADDGNREMRERLGMLTALLCLDFPAVGAQPARTASERLSTGEVHVFERDGITGVKPEPLRTEEGHPVVRLSFTVLCSGLAVAGTVPNQPDSTGILTAPEWVDVLEALRFNQFTAGVVVTVNGPSDGSAKEITVSNEGEAAITIAPGGVSVASGAEVVMVWGDGPAEWSVV